MNEAVIAAIRSLPRPLRLALYRGAQPGDLARAVFGDAHALAIVAKTYGGSNEGAAELLEQAAAQLRPRPEPFTDNDGPAPR